MPLSLRPWPSPRGSKRAIKIPAQATQKNGGGFYEPADDVGYIPKAGKQVAERGVVADDSRLHIVVDGAAAPEGRVIYDVTYTIRPR